MDGILVIDKPAGWTSHDVVARARRMLGERRIGHTGTLDPFATGVLVLLVGRATRLAQFLAGAEKEYEAIVRFGYATVTGDLTGAPCEEAKECPMWDEEKIEGAIKSLRGEIEQVPPLYSAKKIGGQKLYELARRGQKVERRPLRVVIYELEALRGDGALLRRNSDGTCDLRVRVRCSAGTYVRALAEDLGRRLGIGAHLRALRRTRAGAFSLADALTLDELEAILSHGGSPLLPAEAALRELPSLHLTEDQTRRIRHGATISSVGEGLGEGQMVRLHDEAGRLAAIGVYARGRIQPRIVLMPTK
ncbi:tRNA pseudouridine(55) synthase TruB [Pyrinomonas methylaliphatogenes]|jgi:tRNA pseudouridine55 synthase|uniref:tRNA pseudouridine synthase B n=1 Tax=Pyrinomonas methylaliphatogenes TaxID=454194 RepID=A0A0B6X476_9BACT|nr:tRNA pseudouridine(55) synthase TruB [Pyrinomonas methylaliphatogenes]MBX5479846.1 tRNA pseudouridine(55) synthase TruB [Pyrinomonas methylaliphatogenes]CDM67040.1 tRNA pseudouridine synthase B [Pyrinomonas methylaliphatogenes]